MHKKRTTGCSSPPWPACWQATSRTTVLRCGWRAVLAFALACTAPCGAAQERVAIPRVDARPGARAIALVGHWFAAPPSDPLATAPAAAVVLLHGCGGAYDGRGRLSARLREYVSLLNGMGLHALVLDSFSPRGVREICTQPSGTRLVTQADRRLDAYAAMRWLAERDDVDAARIGLLGWSNGGSAVLAATNLALRDVARARVRSAFAVAFYPGCAWELKRGYRPSAPLLLLVGSADDWTPAEPCRKLAEQAADATLIFREYAGAHHGFDGTGPVRARTDVPNGARPGEGVHVGGDPEARRQSREELRRFLAHEVTR
jgi:dienelactone hydrolase